jgi:hypothetical protein
LITRYGSTGSTASRARSSPSVIHLVLVLAATTIAVIGCSSSGSDSAEASDGSSPGSGGDAGTIEEASSLFVPSAADPSLVEFQTNDGAYITDRGYTLWALKAEAQNPFVSRTVVLDKTSGSMEAGYGIVFCHHGADERMLVAMIDAQQEYIVGEAVGSTFTAIAPWTGSAYLKKGYNQDNEIGIRLDAATRTFCLSINGNDVKTFSAIETDYSLSGDNGFLVVVSPWDSFPGTPVSVKFREK